MRLLAIRHPVPEVANGVCYGRLDVPARPEALQSVLWRWDHDLDGLCAQAAGVGRVLSSPARRCLVLAQALASRMGVPVEVDPGWQELDFGCWEGRRWDCIARAEVDAWAADAVHVAPGGGESPLAMMARVVRSFEAWRAAGRDAVLVAHAGTIRMLQAWAAQSEAGVCEAAAAPAVGADPRVARLEAAARYSVTLASVAPGEGFLLRVE